MRRIALAVLFLTSILPGIAWAQTCAPPVIVQVGGTNPSCTGQPVMLDAGSGWTTYQWSPGGATTRMISDSPNGTMSYTVTTTDANGCSVTSQPLTVVVNATPAAPSIQLREATLCGGAQGEATVTGTWSSYAWSVTNGTIASGPSSPGANGPTVDYTASETGPISVSVTVTDSNGCAVTASADVALRTIAKPTMQTYPAAICAGSFGSASINPPAEGTWQSYHWTVTNGTIAQWSGDSGANVSFNSDAGGQAVTVQVTATDSYGCTSTSDLITIPVRTIPKPTMQTYPAAICAGSFGSASINPPAEGSWQSFHWTVTNGTIAQWSSDSGAYVSFNSDTAGQPVIVQVTATDSYGCTSTSDPITIPVRTIPKPTMQTYPAAICAGSFGSASINPPAEGSWQSFHWTVTNGTIAQWSSDSGAYVSFNSGPAGQPVIVQVTATDSYGCTSTSDPITIPVRTIPKPTMQTYPAAICAGSFGSASINPPAEGSWQSFHWTVTNGTIAQWSSDSGAYVSFNSGTAGQPVIVQVTATDSYGCTSTSDPITIPVRTISKPTVQTYPEAICPGSNGSAQINAPAEGGSWQSYHWTVTNGTIAESSGDSNSYVSFNSSPSGGQPVTVQVTATDSYGCTATSDPITIPARVLDPAITVDMPPACAGSSAQVSLAPPSDPSVTWQNIQWTVTGGTILDGATSSVMHLQTDPAGGTAVVTVSVQTSQGCSGTASTTLTTTAAVTPSLSTGPTSICAGGSAEVDVNDNWSLFQSFHWTVTHATISGNSTNPYVFLTADGTGDVTATLTAVTVSGCTGSSSVTYRLGGPDATITAPPSGSFCAGSQITVSVPDAGPGAAYQWTINGSQVYGGGPTVTFTPSTTSIELGVTVIFNGCSSSGSKSLTALAAPQATLSAPSRICYLSTGNTATLSDPGPGVTIEWPANTASLRVTPTADPRVAHFDSVPYQYFNGYGSITAKLTNASGCVSYVVASVVVDFPYAVPSAGGPTTFCLGGSVMIYGNPFGTGYSYLWSNGATTENINATQSGSYTVTVTDPAGCSFTSSAINVTVNTPATPTITADGPTTFCGTGSVTLTSSAGASYSWSNGATTQAVTVPSGSYTVTVTDANGCSATSAPAVVTGNTPPPTPTITAFTPTTFCAGHSVTLYASSASGYSYAWSNGATTSSIVVTTAGAYSVIVTDANGCSATSAATTVTVTPTPPTPAVTASGPTVFCEGGSVTLTAPDGYTYSWSNGATTQSITVSQSAVYSVTVRNASGCTATSTGTIVNVNLIPTPFITPSGPTLFCAGESVTLSAGSGYASYLWSNGATTPSINVTTSGSYSVTVTTSDGCSGTTTATTVTVNPLPSAVIVAGGPTTFCSGGSVNLNAPPSMVGYTWSNGATTQVIHVTAPGAYSVTTRNMYGCTATSTPTVVTVNANPPKPAVTAGGPTTFCAGGSVTLTASPGSSYQWSNGTHTQSIIVSNTGNYYVAVYDANGCGTASDPVSVTVNPPPVATISFGAPNAFCDGGQPIVLTSSLAASYLWSTGQTTRSVSFNQAGTYNVTVTVTDANGCSATSQPQPFRINTLPPTTITANGPTTFCTPGSVLLTAPIPQSQMFDPNTDGPYTYLWSTGATTSSITATQSGSYSVTVTNYFGCSATSVPTVVTANDPPKPAITADGPTLLCTTSGQTVTLRASDGAASYAWYSGEHSQSITVNHGGTFTVIATYANGCQRVSDPFVVSEDALWIQPSGPTTFCQGSVTLTAQSNATSFSWSNGATTPSITVSNSGTYSVTATFADGCTMTRSQSVTSSNGFSVSATPALPYNNVPVYICPGQPMRYTANASGGRPPYTYQWYRGNLEQLSGQTGPTFDTTEQSMWFSVVVTDAGGCSINSNLTQEFAYTNSNVNILPLDPTTFCQGGSVRLSAGFATTTDGLGPVSYLWTNGATTQQISVSTAGSYGVTVIDNYGCTTVSAPVVITVNPMPDATITASGPTAFCAGGSVTLSAPSGMSSYSWSNGATTQSINATSSGSFTVTVRNANGCFATSPATVVNVNANPSSVVTASGPTTFCAGGSVTLTAPSGYAYSWSNGATTQAITASTGGNYSVTVTNASGCSATSSPTSITVNALPSASITAGGPTTFCAGGSVTLTSSSGTSYSWSNGATTQSIIASASGSYSVTVTNGSGCSTTSTPTVVTANANPTATITAGGPATFCTGGSVALTASSGASYLWSTGATTQSIAATTGGNYSVTVTNANGCSATSAPTSVTVNALPAATITPGGPTTFCAGGSVTLTASSGASYLWSTGATTQAIAASASGSYSVTVTNGNGCSATSAPTAVTVNAAPTATITAGGPTTFCAGGSVTLTASNGASYLWSTGATTQAITASTGGSYSVTVTNTNGCSTTSTPAVVTANANPTATITAGGPTTFCTGGSVTLTASSGTSYLWSNGATTQSIAASTGGNYSVTVTNANGCSAASAPASVTVNALPAATITPGGSTTFCAGGSVTLTASTGASYLWSTGATTQAIAASASGNYSVTVTNANGCSATSSSIVVTVNAGPAASITAGGPTTFCAGGSVTLTASSGSSYLWSTGATTASITVNSGGNYSVTVTGANGCSTTSAPTAVTVNTPSSATITASGPTTFCAGSNVMLSATVGASYLWSNGATSQFISVTDSGSYSVTVTDANGCSSTSAPTVTTRRPYVDVSITPSGPNYFCAGGSVTLTAGGGVSYLWSTGVTTTSIVVNATGWYGVTATNDVGCTTGTSYYVQVNPNPSTPVVTASGPTTFCAGGSVTLTAPNGFSYLWSNGATSASISVNSSGSYNVRVTDANGCSATSASTVVTVNTTPSTITAGGPTTFCAGGSVTLTASSGASYLWSTGATTQAITVNASGNFSVAVTGANGCSATSAPTAVTVNANPTASITAGGPTTFCAGGSVALTASSGSSYLWSNGATTQAIAASSSGNYSVTVTNANGCSATSAPTSVTVNASPTASITAGGPTTFCAGGSVTLTASSGASYLWSTGATTQAITVNAGGNYSVAVTGANGCSATSAPTSVTVNANPTASITAGGPTTFCAGGSVTLTASSGSSYLWSNGVTTQAIAVTSGGNYTVRVTNAAGCNTTSAPTVVTVKPLPTATVSGGGAICPGGSATITAALTGTAPWSVTWSDGNIQTVNSGTTATRNVSPATTTTYTVTTVSDAKSCPVAGTGSATVTLNVAGSITTQPTNKTTTRNTSVTLTVVAAGTAPISYQWFKGNGTSISGATSSSYTTSFPNKGNNTFYVEVWNACNTTHVRSNTVTVTVN